LHSQPLIGGKMHVENTIGHITLASTPDIIPRMPFKLQGRLPYALLVVAILVLDRWTKALVLDRFDLNASVSVIDGFFNITYVRNTGVAFGIFSSISSPVKSIVLSIFTACAAVAVITYSYRSPLRNRLLQVALALILGGALGNLYDRLAYGYVVDFLEFYLGNYHWPAFNIADSAISTGVVLLALEIIRNETPARS
jgi:signal peptidase II